MSKDIVFIDKDVAGQVWWALAWNHYVDARTIANLAGIKRERTAETVRTAARYLNSIGLPVVSSNSGFCKTTNTDEIGRYLSNLRARKAGLEEREGFLIEILTKGNNCVAAWEETARDILSTGEPDV